MGLRIGIDVGGTFTKAVIVDAESGGLVGKAAVLTTHRAPEGVARGAVEAFRTVLQQTGVPASSVQLVVLSTTQAVNALLEGDVAPVGVLGMGSRRHRADALRCTRLGSLELGSGKRLPLHFRFVETDELQVGSVRQALVELRQEGARAVAVSAAYAVEDPTPERVALDVARELGVPATAGHEMSGLYGLEVRTYTAAVNASILPRMMEVLAWVESSMRQAGLTAPLMVMHGDLDMVPVAEARRAPVFTVLSGPAASVAGAAPFCPVLDGLFMEVGGTSTNIGVLRHGRPVTRYVTILDHPTCLRSVDVRVTGVAGGSLVRVRKGRIVAVGPRSAHIAGLPYPSFAPPQRLDGLKLVTVAPCPGDPDDYAVVQTPDGRRFALTPTDAANALGRVPSGDHARGSQESARRALRPLAEQLGVRVERAAELILEAAAWQVQPVLERLIREYGLRDVALLGLGGGARVLVPFVAARMGLRHQIVPHAEVIASLGAAMAPVGLQMERQLDGRQPKIFAGWLQQALHEAERLGAAPGQVRVVAEPLPERRALHVRAVGPWGGAGHFASGWGEVDPRVARALAAQALGLSDDQVRLALDSGFYWVFEGEWYRGMGPWRRRCRAVAVVDRGGEVHFAAREGAWWPAGNQAGQPPAAAEPAPSPNGRADAAALGPAAVVAGPYLARLPEVPGQELALWLQALAREAGGLPTALVVGRAERRLA